MVMEPEGWMPYSQGPSVIPIGRRINPILVFSTSLRYILIFSSYLRLGLPPRDLFSVTPVCLSSSEDLCTDFEQIYF